MAKELKAKEPKKKGRRLKRTVRKTLGTICLISAILIATIPTEGLKRVSAVPDSGTTYSKLDEAAVETYAKNLNSNNVIPDLLTNYSGGKVYNSGNGFQFAYASPAGQATGDDRMAVIVGFSENAAQLSGTLVDGVMTIPQSLDAYLNYTATDGSYSFVAVSKDGGYLFYEQKPEETVTTSEGDVTTPAVYQPCYYSDYDKWKDIDDEDLYYYPTNDTKPDNVTSPIRVGDIQGSGTNKDNKMRIKNAQVRYIGNHYAELSDNGDYVIQGKTNSSNRIFGNISNVTTLKIEADLYGIGNYAFYGCSSLRQITLNSSLGYIGNYAFAGCNNMTTATLDTDMRLDVIGAHAFEDCQALNSFTVPHNVKIIGDAAFKGCAGDTSGLQTIDLRGGGNPSLRLLGCDLFVDCNKLQSVTFPGSLEEDVDISNFEGCLSLQYIAVSSKATDITEGFKTTFGYEEFKAQYNQSAVVHGTFYFEGPSREDNPSVLHKTARDYFFAFSYLAEGTLEKQNLYELTVEAGTNKKATYRVDNSNVLVSTKLDDKITTIDLPEYIGPYYIETIGTGVFQNQCYLEQLTIPSTVQKIETDAFSGCHQLEYVLFENPAGLVIEDGAFQTQKVTHKSWCDNQTLPQTPKLTFVGPISTDSEPFRYAMSEANRISVGTQTETYITYFSGWPDCLTVQHNPKTGKNELTDYLTLNDLSNASSSIVSEIYSHIDSDLRDDYTEAMTEAYRYYAQDNTTGSTTTYADEIWDSVLNIVLPEGIEGIQAGLFKTKEVDSNEAGNSYFQDASHYKTLVAYGLKEVAGDDDPDDGVDSGCFANCTTLGKIELYDGTETIGDYAFKGCERLQSVTLPNTVRNTIQNIDGTDVEIPGMGKIPFTGCPKLSHVNFQGSPYYTCDNSIIYRLDAAGNKYEIIEYLEGRSSQSVTASEVEGVKAIAEEAFSGTNVSFVDLSSSWVETIPTKAFAGCEKLIQVILPNSLASVKDYAFTGCPNLQRITVPGMYTDFYTDAVDTAGPDRPDDLVFVCNEDSLADRYAIKYGFKTDHNGVEISYKVVFEDWDGTVLKTEYVVAGQDATPPEDPTREGYVFSGWNKDYLGVSSDLTVTATYVAEDPNAKKVTVTFYDDDATTVLYTRSVTIGEVVELPPDPVKEGYLFVGWIGTDPSVTEPITRDTSFIAKWEEKDGRFVVQFIDWDGTVLSKQLVEPGEAPIDIKEPTRKGYTFTGWLPSDFSNITKDTDIYATYTKKGSSGSGDDSDDSVSGNKSSKLYTLTVQNGSGSGSYVAGSQPVIVANDPPSGKEFSNWTIDPSGTKIASTTLSATVITMPSNNVTVTAHYKTKSGSSSGSGSVSGNSSNRPNSSSGTLSNGTTVIIDKNGLSNTGVVTATVKGSSDNFVIKITESSSASEAIVKALQAEYGDISNIKYFPMDISLYDSTGTKKITDTTGLSISITLPLPDSLITYAGNNKVAGVVNNRLDKLSPKFTTIDGVACVTFTAEHFSPYVIYVETDNLTASVVADNTPKTGDGIHPKWFLSIGLACVAVVLFMKKDKRSLQTAKAV